MYTIWTSKASRCHCCGHNLFTEPPSAPQNPLMCVYGGRDRFMGLRTENVVYIKHLNFFYFISTAPPDITNHFLDKNSNQDVGTVSFQEVDSLNNLTSSSPNNSSLSVDQNLNFTLSTKPSPAEGLSPSTPLTLALRPPSLSVLSPLNKPDPSEVDDEAPVTSDSSPDSNLIPSHDICLDPDLLNGNVNSDTVPSNTKLTCEPSDTIITWVEHYQTNMHKGPSSPVTDHNHPLYTQWLHSLNHCDSQIYWLEKTAALFYSCREQKWMLPIVHSEPEGIRVFSF